MPEMSRRHFRSATNTLRLAIPLFGAEIALFVAATINVVFASSLSDAALSGVASSSYVIILFTGLASGIRIALQREVASRHNLGQTVHNQAILHFFLSYALAAVVLALMLYSAIPWLAHVVASDAEVITYIVEYSRVIAITSITFPLVLGFNAFYTGLSKTWFAYRSLLAVHTLDVMFTYLLFQTDLSPLQGRVSAIGLGTFCAYLTVGCVVMFLHRRWFVKAMPHLVQPWRYLKTILHLARIHLSMGLAGTMYFTAWGLTYKIVGQIGVSETAVLAVLANLFLLPVYFSQSVGAVLMTQLSGATKQPTAKSQSYEALALVFTVAVLFSVGLYFLANPVADLYFGEDGPSRQLFFECIVFICLFIPAFVGPEVLKNVLYAMHQQGKVNLYMFLCHWVFFLGGSALLVGLFAVSLQTIIALLIAHRFILLVCYHRVFSNTVACWRITCQP